MEKLYKRFLAIIIMPVICAAFPFFVFAGNADTKAIDWYFKPTSDNTAPELCPEADFLSDYDALTIGDTTQKTVYLTFDAGYDNGCHQKILDTLKEKKVSAAFFIDGNFVKTNPELVRRMADEGHLVCNHSLNHPDMTKLVDFATYQKQIADWEKLVADIGVTPTKYFRFPSGRFSKLAMDYNKKLGLTTVFWSFAYYDWDQNDQPSRSAALQKIYSRMHGGAILLLHSTSETNADILAELIDGLSARGYRLESIASLKNNPVV